MATPPTPDAATTAAAPDSRAAPATSGVAVAAPSFLDVRSLPPGPIAVHGYPHPIRNLMNDVADHVGFTSDGALFGYCAEGGGREERMVTCELLDAGGQPTKMSSDDDAGFFVPTKKRAIDAFIRDRGLPALGAPTKSEPMQPRPPPFRGTWRFTDITLEVLRVEPSDAEKRTGKHAPAVLRVGGAVGAEPPVFPITLSASPVPQAPAHFAAMNGMTVSPDGAEVGMVGTFFSCEYCDWFAVKRMKLSTLAALIYNDAGYRAHVKKSYARAAELFAKAVDADPNAKLPAYNLACALAQLRSPKTSDALRFAITVDAAARARATKDQDFDSVRAESWFNELTR